MPSTKTIRFWLASLTLACIIFSACVANPRVLAIPSVAAAVRPAAERINDYPEALAVIVSVMARDLALPAVEGTVTFYPNRFSYESGLVAELENVFDVVEKQLAPDAQKNFRATREENIAFNARRTATTTIAIGMYRRVLVNEILFLRQTWSERMGLLAHELTHTVEREVGNPLISGDRWLSEGFAEWVASRVLDTLGLDTFGKIRERRVDVISKAKAYQTFPTLTQLARPEDWQTWTRTLGLEATYGQAFMGVDFLIEQKGHPAVVEYFRLFRKQSNREVNFATAFGEPVAEFEGRFAQHLESLLGR